MKNIAIITGASSGMGKEFAMQIAQKIDVSELWLISRNENNLKKTQEDVLLKTGVPSIIIPLDLLDENSFFIVKDKLEKSDVNVKILVNSSGFGISGDSSKIDMKKQSNMIDLNCKALFNMTHVASKYMSKDSHIIQIASAASYVPQPGFAIYAATKSFVLSYSIALSQELANRGIGVTTVCPGPVDTNFFNANEKYSVQMPKFSKILFKKPSFVVEKTINGIYKNKKIINPGLQVKLLYLFTFTYLKQLFAIISKKFYR